MLVMSGIAVLVLSWPIFWSYLAALPGNSVHRQIVNRVEVSDQDLARLAGSRKVADARLKTARHLSDLSLAIGIQGAISDPVQFGKSRKIGPEYRPGHYQHSDA